MRLVLIVSFLFSSLLTLHGQMEKIVHQTFALDDIETIRLELEGEIEVVNWAGNTVLTETKIQLFDASKAIFNHFVENGRYEVESELINEIIQLKSKDKERKPIRTRKGECFETINVRVFVPEDFSKLDETSWGRS